MTPSACLIAIAVSGDGLTAWVLDAEGDVLAHHEVHAVLSGAPRDVPAAVRYHLREWLGEWPDAPVIVSGAADSAKAREPGGFLQVPLRVEDIAANLVLDDKLWLVPGLHQASPPDMTSGAEAGLLAIEDVDGMVCIPGTQSRHFVIEHGRLLGFTTELTGEIRNALLRHERAQHWLRASQVFDEKIFQHWAEGSLDTADAVSPFAVHAACATGLLDAALYDCALSGLLIGAEVAAHYDPGDEVTLIADGDDLEKYGLALDTLEADVTEYSATECLRDGLFEIADLAGLLDA